MRDDETKLKAELQRLKVLNEELQLQNTGMSKETISEELTAKSQTTDADLESNLWNTKLLLEVRTYYYILLLI